MIRVKVLQDPQVNAETKVNAADQLVKVNIDEVQTIHGKDGKSAYEIALDNGFQGTETEWLDSLHGRDGIDGKAGYTPVKGVDYFDGKDGQDGKDGYTPVKGIDYFDGKDGSDGKDGYTPVKGEDYFTEADKAEMVSAVVAALPVYNGEVVAV